MDQIIRLYETLETDTNEEKAELFEEMSKDLEELTKCGYRIVKTTQSSESHRTILTFVLCRFDEGDETKHINVFFDNTLWIDQFK